MSFWNPKVYNENRRKELKKMKEHNRAHLKFLQGLVKRGDMSQEEYSRRVEQLRTFRAI